MPLLEYVCTKCHHKFEAMLTLQEHESKQVSCPECNSRKIEQDVAEFFAVTSPKS
jgi:putative FmdB family regulatory protein